MNILAFNWRDIKHPQAGGAEIVLYEQAKRWVKKGYKVTLFCGAFDGCKEKEVIDGIEIIRKGGKYSVYLHAFWQYVTKFRGKYDVVIDVENGIPFFSPLFSFKPKILVMHHVHKDVFAKELKFPLSWFAWFLEVAVMPLVYCSTKVVAVSESTKKELSEIGFNEDNISVVYDGIDLEKYRFGKKGKKPVVIYVGRLKKYKRIGLLIDAFKLVLKEIHDARLVIVGSGDEEEQLRKKAKGINGISFTGFVSEKDKIKILQEAWCFVTPSFKEGWGVSVIEANACGTPAIAFDVPGLRDSIVDGETGLIVKEDGNAKMLAETIIKILKDEKLRKKLSENSLRYARKFSWDKSAEEFLKVIEGVVNE